VKFQKKTPVEKKRSIKSQVFQKRRVFYGLDRATKAVSQSGEIILVEGYTDVIHMHQAGIENTIAGIGTALTQDHAQLLIARFPEAKIILLYDGDEAGTKATLKAGALLLPKKDTLVSQLPPEKDPANILEEKGNIREYLDKRVDFLTFYLTHYAEQAGDSLRTFAGKRALLQRVQDELWEDIPSHEKPIFLHSVAETLGLRDSDLERFLVGRETRPHSRGEVYWEERLLGQLVSGKLLSLEKGNHFILICGG